MRELNVYCEIYPFDQIPEMLIQHPHVESHLLKCYHAYEREGIFDDAAPYIEVQIHGALSLSKSISKLIITGKNEEIRKSAEKFAEKNNCEVIFLS